MAENEETSGQGTGEPGAAAAADSGGAASSPEAGEADRAQSPGEQTQAQESAGASAESETGEIRLTGEKVLDIALGLGMLAAEALEKAISQVSERAKVAQQHAPAILDALEEKGRPAREKLLANLRESNLYQAKKAEEGEGAAGKSADEEITALEERVRELEKQVDAPGGTSLPSGDLRFESRSPATPEAPTSPSGETPAERATLDFAEQPQSLSHTPYDVASDAPQAADEGPAIEVHPVTGTSRESSVDPPAASASAAGDDSDAMTADETPLPETGSDAASAEAAFDPEAPEKKKGRGRKSSSGGGPAADDEETA